MSKMTEVCIRVKWPTLFTNLVQFRSIGEYLTGTTPVGSSRVFNILINENDLMGSKFDVVCIS